MSPKLLFSIMVCLLFSAPSIANKATHPKDIHCDLDDGGYEAEIKYAVKDSSVSIRVVVDVADCQVTKIYFHKAGYAFNDNITPADINGDEEAFVTGENGKTYKVTIDDGY